MRLIAAALLGVLGCAAPAFAQNGTTVGTLTLSAKFVTLDYIATYTGDANATNSATVQFRRTGDATWLTGYAPPADRRAVTSANDSNTANQNQFRGVVFGAVCGTSYDVQITYTDADGVSGGPSLSSAVTTVACTPPVTGVQKYVDCSAGGGGDGSSGTPWNTLSTANTNAAAGDTVHVRASSCAPVTWTKSGTAGSWVVIVGDDRDSCFITGGAVTNNLTLNADYVQFKNLRFKQTLHNSIEVSAHHDIWLENLYHEDISSTHTYNDAGVFINASSVTNLYILSNTFLSPTGATVAPVTPNRYDSETCAIYNNGSSNAGWVLAFNQIGAVSSTDSGFRDGIGNTPETMGGGLDHSDIYNNDIWGVRDDAIQMEGTDNLLRIFGNTAHANNGPVCYAQQASLVGPVYFVRNTCNLNWNGTTGAGWKAGGAQFTILFHNATSTSVVAHDCYGDQGLPNLAYVIARNNIWKCHNYWLYQVNATDTAHAGNSAQAASDLDYDQVYRLSGSTPIVRKWNFASTPADYNSIVAFQATGNETHGQLGDPLFLDTALHIDTTSPAYNKGVSIANINDASSTCPAIGSPDMGAFEVGGCAAGPASLTRRTLRLHLRREVN